jgi:hypothetical protein
MAELVPAVSIRLPQRWLVEIAGTSPAMTPSLIRGNRLDVRLERKSVPEVRG